MVQWDPKDEMGAIAYLKFKLGYWVQVSTVPEWVTEAHLGYYRGFTDKYGHRPYDVEKVFTGDSLRYRVFYRTAGQGEIKEEFYVKLKR